MAARASSSPAPTISVTSSDQTPKASKDSTDHSFNSANTSAAEEHAGSRAVPIPTLGERRFNPLHLDLPQLSTSFRDRLLSESPWEGSSRLQRMAQGIRRFTPSSPGARPSEPAWSLFGDVMEGDGQLHSLGSTRIKRRRAKNEPESLYSSYASLRESEETDPFLLANEQPPTVDTVPRNDIPKRLTISSSPERLTDDASETTVSSAPIVAPKTLRSWSLRNWLGDLPILYRNILKCAFAYFFASLFTFHPYLSGLLSNFSLNGPGDRRPSPSGHMVATVWVSLLHDVIL